MILSYTTVGFVQGLDHDVYDTIVLYNSDSSHREVKSSLAIGLRVFGSTRV